MFVCLFTVICILAWLPYSRQECVYTHWSVWGACHAPPHLSDAILALNIPQKCADNILQRIRTRELIFLQESDRPCPRLTETASCESEGARGCLADSWDHYANPIDPFHWRTGPWGECRQLIGQNVSCGVGLERRNVSCFDRNNSQSAVSLCPAPGPPDSRVCHFSCPCQLSPWGQWSPCLAPSCGLVAGNRTRFRSVARQPTYGSCPSLWQREECSEHVTCQTPAVFEWIVASGWSDCDVTGFSHRLVLCYRRNGSATFLSPISNCPLTRPLSRLPCSPAAVYSEWGDWGSCGDTCPSLRARSRQLISGGSSQLTEYSLCDSCTSSNFSCSLYNSTSAQLYSQSCNQTLASDVILSHWSDWSICHNSTSSRSRDLMGYPTYSIPANIPFRITQQRICVDVTHSWSVSDWSDCVTDSNCFQGFQTRNVECLDSSDHSSVYCGLLDEPPSNRTCEPECGDSSPCLYSDWSVSSECSSVCGVGTINRKRIVLRSADCSHSIGSVILSEEQCVTRECPPSYHWRIKEFGDCIALTQHGNCGPGYRTAGTECLSDSGKIVSAKYCGESPLPPSEALLSNCSLPCSSCSLSQWGPFAPCPSFCGADTRSRTRHIIGPPCPNLAGIPLTESLPCPLAPCPSYRWDPVSRWSHCEPLDTLCGRGMRHRAVACLRSDSVPFPDSFCPQSPHPVLKECYTPCPTPCLPGEWTLWSSCSASCDGGVRHRSRLVLSPGQFGGQQCPALFQLSHCSLAACPAPLWVAGEWSPCVAPGPACGFGTKQRTVRCPTGTNSCPLPDRPPASLNCYLHCPPDCVQTEWGQWTPCVADRQNRTREVLRGREGAGVSCGSSHETRECPLSVTHWSYSPFSPCSTLYAPCGTGNKYRNYSCEYAAGGHAPSHLCLSEWGPPSPLSQPCTLSCPTHCLVSAFSDWSDCSGTCTSPSGVQTRLRYVTEPPRDGGTLCPPLQETRPCFLSSCPLPSLFRGQWSPCQTHTRSCGAGQMVRSVLCLDKFGSSLPLSVCVPPDQDPFSPFVQLDLDTRTRAACSIPCPDTVLPAEILPPSNCSSLCSDTSSGLMISTLPLGYLLPGPHTPPGDLSPEYLTQECVPLRGTCLSLEWRTSEWVGADRAVWCEASTPLGVRNVTAGCDPSRRPSASRAPCLPSCPSSSLCSELSGRCQCLPEFQLSGGRCVPLQGCREDSHCPTGQVCNSSQECVSPPEHSNPTVVQLGQPPAVVYYVTIGLVSLLILLCLFSVAIFVCLSIRLSRNRSFSFKRSSSVLSQPPAYSSMGDFTDRDSSLLSRGPSVPYSAPSHFGDSPQRSQSDPLLWSPLPVYRSFSAPLTPPPPPYRYLQEQEPEPEPNSLD